MCRGKTMIIKEISKDFWRLELRSSDGNLIWYAPTKEEAQGKHRRWMRDKELDRVNLKTPQPTIAADNVAHLE